VPDDHETVGYTTLLVLGVLLAITASRRGRSVDLISGVLGRWQDFHSGT
jgi:hypothetical protein